MAVLAVWIGIHVNRVHKQQTAVDTILRSGGSVHYEYQTDETGRYLPEPQRFQVRPFGTRWLRNWLGPHHFNSVVAVSLSRGEVSDDDLACLTGLPKLKSLGLEKTGITNRGVAHLKNLKHLRYLYLGNTEVDDEGLENVSHLRHLLYLQLSPKTTNDGLKCLSAMSKLRNLTLCQTQVTDHGLRHLEPLTTLKRVLATSTDITEEGAKNLQRKIPGLTVHVDRREGRLAESRFVIRGSLGGEITRLGVYLNAKRQVQKILPFSPASQADIKIGDVVVRFAGQEVGDHAALMKAVYEQKLGAKIAVETRRADKTIKTEVVLDNF